MKRNIFVLGFFILNVTFELFGQAIDCNSFSTQLKTYKSFIEQPIHLPRNQKDIVFDQNQSLKFLNPNYGVAKFYLDSNNIAWGGNWFACKYGGIGRRWNSKTTKQFADSAELSMQSNQQFWQKVRTMSDEDISQLSPVEKFDIYQGNTFFWASNYELKSRGPYRPSKEDDNYCGFCNGARAAGALLPEPTKKITVKTKSKFIQDTNIRIVFYPADLKALAAASCFYLDSVNVINLGVNYDSNFSINNQCNPNPGVLDIILREYLASYNIPLFLDVMPNSEKWNETILGYDRVVNSITPNTNSAINAKYICKVALKIYSQDEVSIKDINMPTKKFMSNKSYAVSNRWVKETLYSYNLYLDDRKRIIGGVWTSEPIDYIWLGKGEGADHTHFYRTDTQITKGYTGNQNLIFKDIFDLIKLSSGR